MNARAFALIGSGRRGTVSFRPYTDVSAMLRTLLVLAGTFTVSFTLMWLWVEVLERVGAYLGVRLRGRPVDATMFGPDLLAW